MCSYSPRDISCRYRVYLPTSNVTKAFGLSSILLQAWNKIHSPSVQCLHPHVCEHCFSLLCAILSYPIWPSTEAEWGHGRIVQRIVTPSFACHHPGLCCLQGFLLRRLEIHAPGGHAYPRSPRVASVLCCPMRHHGTSVQ